MKELKEIQCHEFKARLQVVNVRQALLARNLGISQSGLGQMLNGWVTMPPHIYDEILELLEHLERI